MRKFTHSMTIMGVVTEVKAEEGYFKLKCRSGDEFDVFVGDTTEFRVLRNLDGLDRDRVLDPEEGFDDSAPRSLRLVKRYVWPNGLLTAQGIHYIDDNKSRFEARTVHLLHSKKERYLFEDSHWWLTQTARLADEWLDDLFGEKRSYVLDDFAALYRTTLNMYGMPTDDSLQECAVLSRLIYGLSSAYLLTGTERYFLAARAAVNYQRETFRNLSHDGQYCFWAFGKRRNKYGSELIVPSENGEDRDTIPLYEQIYALAGLTQFYRITADWEVLEDIRRTVKSFNAFYLDEKSDERPYAKGYGGYFSHIDYATMRPDTERLGNNRMRKNWNSIGDHIPAYLINLIAALDPLPKGRVDVEELSNFLTVCKQILDTTSNLIAEKFPDKDERIPYVDERFYEDWTPDHSWGWQQNRAVVGHNLKISWNLTRVANYYLSKNNPQQAAKLMNLADRLGKTMAEVGIDQIRGGCFDALEREPKNGMPVEFSWGNTKDFWQQEQAILAYLILYGYTKNKDYLQMARELMAFWNIFFLDHSNHGTYFRVTDDGLPYAIGNYINKGGHSDSGGYHVFELNYLAHLYIRSYVDREINGDNNFCLFFRPSANSKQRSINVLPDFFKPGDVEIVGIVIGGVRRTTIDPDNYQIELNESELGSEVIVEFKTNPANKPK
jgi:mannose/cellobiose epimerase-like protein (N-acyl-D-glucosamine 2-epimerase family)